MRQLSLVLLLLCLSVAGYSQITASSYGFTATSGTFSSISGSGTYSGGTVDDDNTETGIPIGFNFNFCGTDYTTLSACSNGWLSLSDYYGTGSVSRNNTTTNAGTISGSAGILMPYWYDLNGISGGAAYYQTTGSAPNRIFTFEWNNFEIYMWPYGSGPFQSFQVKLYETSNIIEFIYSSGSFGSSSASIGIAKESTDYLTLSDPSSAPTTSSVSFLTSISGAPGDGQIYRFTPPPPCSGTIEAGTAHADVTTVCAADHINLSLTGTTAATALTYQWQRSNDFGATWVDIPGGTSSSFTTMESEGTMFRALVTCPASGSTDSTAGIYINFTTACYCTPSYNNSPSTVSWSMGLDQVNITGYAGSTLSDAGPSVVPASGYEDRTFMSVDLQQGNTYSGTLSYLSTVYQYQSQVWIDFNDDGNFDASEAVTPVISSGFGSWALSDGFSITIPITAPIGSYKMRVRYADMDWTGSSLSTAMDPCLSWDGTNSYQYGVTRDYYANIIAAPACAGSPTAGTATASATLACPATDFTLNVSGITVATGLTYQWEDSSATTGGAWVSVPGATSYPYNTSVTEPTWFRLSVTCTASSTTVASSTVFVNYFGFCYCVPTYSSAPASGSFDGIDVFDVTGYGGSSISDAVTSPAPTSGYVDNTSMTPLDVQQGNMYSGTISYMSTYNNYESQIWIDMNDNGTFETSEEVTGIINSGSYASSSPFTMNIALTAPVGLHRMRVRYASLSWGGSVSADMDPCASFDATNTYWNGIARDYMVNIIAAPACTGTPVGGTATASTTLGCPATSFTLNATGSSVATGLTYQWQESSSATGPWTDIPGATTVSYDYTVAAPTYFQLVVTCPASSSSGTSSSVFVNYLGFCYCTPMYYYSPASGGSTGLDMFDLTGFSGSSISDGGSTPLPSTGYDDRTMVSIDMQQGQTYTGNVSYLGFGVSAYESQIWIDFNDNGTFETSEEVTAPIYSTTYAMSDAYSITIPGSAPVGTHRMRVRYAQTEPYSWWSGSTSTHMDPCEMYDADNYYYYGVARDYTVNIILLPDCSGAPVVGAAVATPTSGGATIPFTVSAPGVVAAAGVTYQWQSSSSATGPWTDIPGATNTSYSFVSIYADTWYRLLATCTLSGGTTTASDSVMITYVATPPCFPDFSSWFSPDPSYGIDAFNVNGFSTTSIADAGIEAAADPTSGYLDRTALPAVSFEQGLSYPATATFSPSSSYQELQVWIDFNNDGVYEATEEVSPVSGFSTFSTPAPVAFNISIPAGAALGTHSMRVRGVWEQISTTLGTAPAHLDPCHIQYMTTNPHYWSGDVVDYTVNIVPPCLITASATNSGAVCPGATMTLTATTTAPTYSWSGPDGFTSTSLTVPMTVAPGVYTFTATDGACTLTPTTTVSALPAPAAAVLTPTVASICEGSTLTVTATTTPMLVNLFPEQDFEVGVPTDPATAVDGWNTSALNPAYITQVTSGTYPPATAESGTHFASFHSYSYSSLLSRTALISPSFNMTGITGAQLKFWVYRDDYSYPGTWGYTTEGWYVNINTTNDVTTSTNLAFVPRAYDVATSGSVTGTSVPSVGGWYEYTVSIPAAYAGATNYVFFEGVTQYGEDCYLDNVRLTGNMPIAAPTWTPGTYLYSDGAATTSYVTGTSAANVYVHPTSVPATTTIDYVATVTDGTCSTSDTVAVTINVVAPIVAGGTTTICAGTSVSLSTTSTGGTWSTSDASIATVTSSGVVTGTGNGTATISYTVGSCFQTIDVHSSNVVTFNTGTTVLCSGGMTSVLTNPTTGGTWSGGGGTVATIASDGTVTSVGAGTTIVTYTMPSGCSDTSLITIQAPPAAITGTASVCYAGGTTTLADVTPGGVWSSSDGTIATVDASGVVTGLTGGSVNISYTTLPGCYAVVAMTMNANPSPIGGTTSVCTGSVTTLTDLTGTGTWTSGSTGVATVNSSTGAVTGVSNGNAVITFTASNGCYATTTVTVNTTPNPITGTASVCYTGGTTTLSSTTPGGTWTSSNGAIATVTGGVVTALGGGSATITYTMPLTGCYVTRALTLNPNPPAILGTTTVCAGGAQTTLTDAGGTGTWTSGTTAVATVGSGTGVVTGVSNGTSIITFTDANGCRATTTVTVNALPAAITGTTTICNLASTTLADVSLPGTWSTSTSSITTVNASGVVTGVSPGIGTITFTQTSTGCSRSTNVTVNALPTSITGPSSMCSGTATTFTGAPGSGTWSSSPLSVATVVAGSGYVNAVSAGTATVTYTNGVGCYITVPLTVNASTVPSVSINTTPGTTVCEGTTVNYSATVVNGGTPTYSWSVNSVPATTASSYSYVPLNGDIVSLTITSSLGCSIPTTASATITMTVNAIIMPTLNITGAHHDTACDGSMITINTFPSGSAILPTYQWYVNGTSVATGSSYSYTPASGDEVVAVMTSGVSCVSGGGSVTTADTMYVAIAPVIPAEVTLTSTTGATSCAGNIVVYDATGTTPGTFLWTVNGTNVATGPMYFYTPVDGDVVLVTMTSTYLCASPATDTAMMTMSVLASITPVINITTTAGGVAYAGESTTFSANIISGGGTAPTYQWFVNGVAIAGATSPSYSTSTLNAGDVVTCRVNNTDGCGGTTISNSITTMSGVNVNAVTKGSGTIMLLPNPNNGSFVVKGTLGVSLSEDMSLEVTDMLGQTVYTGHTQAKNGEFSQQVMLSGTLANGMYMLTVRSQHMNSVFHFVLEQ